VTLTFGLEQHLWGIYASIPTLSFRRVSAENMRIIHMIEIVINRLRGKRLTILFIHDVLFRKKLIMHKIHDFKHFSTEI